MLSGLRCWLGDFFWHLAALRAGLARWYAAEVVTAVTTLSYLSIAGEEEQERARHNARASSQQRPSLMSCDSDRRQDIRPQNTMGNLFGFPGFDHVEERLALLDPRKTIRSGDRRERNAASHITQFGRLSANEFSNEGRLHRATGTLALVQHAEATFDPAGCLQQQRHLCKELHLPVIRCDELNDNPLVAGLVRNAQTIDWDDATRLSGSWSYGEEPGRHCTHSQMRCRDHDAYSAASDPDATCELVSSLMCHAAFQTKTKTARRIFSTGGVIHAISFRTRDPLQHGASRAPRTAKTSHAVFTRKMTLSIFASLSAGPRIAS